MYEIRNVDKVRKTISVPPDKSISHRAIIFASLSKMKTTIQPFVRSDDIKATLECMKKLGVKAALKKKSSLIVHGVGMYFPRKQKVTLYAHNSGTTMRILSGLLCTQKFPTFFEAGISLSKRPMGRVVKPLQKMNARIRGSWGEGKDVYPPLFIEPAPGLYGVTITLPIASAQVKSALLLAALYAGGITTITEPYHSRDHTERMCALFGGKIVKRGKRVRCFPVKRLSSPRILFIPGDFSSAAFFIVLGLLVPSSEVYLPKININPTRCGLLNVLRRMGAKITIKNKKGGYEPFGDIVVESSRLKATEVLPQELPSMIDEVPILCVAAAYAKGITKVWGVEELLVKETDRLQSMKTNLKKAGVKVDVGYAQRKGKKMLMFSVRGAQRFRSAAFKSFGDHRTAMSTIIFAMAQRTPCTIDGVNCIKKSFPDFISLIENI